MLSSASGKTTSDCLLGRLLVTPDVEVPERRARRGACRAEPGVAVRRVVHHQVDDHAQAPVLRRADHRGEVPERAEPLVDAVVVGDVVAIVAVRRGVERHEPQAAHAHAGEVVDPLAQPREVAHPVVVPVEERLHVEAVDHRVLPPHVARARRAHRGDLRQHPLRERLDEPSLVLAHVVQEDRVDAQLGDLLEPGHVAVDVGRHEHRPPHVVGGHVASGLVELRGQLELPGQSTAEDVGPPLVMRDRERRVLVLGPGEVYLHVHGLAGAPSFAERLDRLAAVRVGDGRW